MYKGVTFEPVSGNCPMVGRRFAVKQLFMILIHHRQECGRSTLWVGDDYGAEAWKASDVCEVLMDTARRLTVTGAGDKPGTTEEQSSYCIYAAVGRKLDHVSISPL